MLVNSYTLCCVDGADVKLAYRSPRYFYFSAPTQQPPPTHEPVNATALKLMWNAPDYPNGVISHYKLYRNGTLIFNGSGDGNVIS